MNEATHNIGGSKVHETKEVIGSLNRVTLARDSKWF
jgi:hypothetical protein